MPPSSSSLPVTSMFVANAIISSIIAAHQYRLHVSPIITVYAYHHFTPIIIINNHHQYHFIIRLYHHYRFHQQLGYHCYAGGRARTSYREIVERYAPYTPADTACYAEAAALSSTSYHYAADDAAAASQPGSAATMSLCQLRQHRHWRRRSRYAMRLSPAGMPPWHAGRYAESLLSLAAQHEAAMLVTTLLNIHMLASRWLPPRELSCRRCYAISAAMSATESRAAQSLRHVGAIITGQSMTYFIFLRALLLSFHLAAAISLFKFAVTHITLMPLTRRHHEEPRAIRYG